MPSADHTGLPPVDAQRVFGRIAWRIIPYIFSLYILAYLDRVNVGFAALEMKRDLHLSNTVYGTGAGIFFLGSSLFDLPSNLMLVQGRAATQVDCAHHDQLGHHRDLP